MDKYIYEWATMDNDMYWESNLSFPSINSVTETRNNGINQKNYLWFFSETNGLHSSMSITAHNKTGIFEFFNILICHANFATAWDTRPRGNEISHGHTFTRSTIVFECRVDFFQAPW